MPGIGDMKKFILTLLISLCACVSFAQKGKDLARVGQLVNRGVVAQTLVQKAVANNLERLAQDGVRLVKITNLPGEPVVPLKTGSSATSSGILSGRMLTGKEVSTQVFSERWSKVQVPLSFNREERVLFKGLRLFNLGQLAHILKSGLEIKKTRSPVVFVTNFFADAIGYSAALYGNMSVVVKVSVPPDTKHILGKTWKHDYLFMQDVPADNILEAVAFMNVEGVNNWYKVILENGKIVLESTPNTVIKMEEVIEQDVHRK